MLYAMLCIGYTIPMSNDILAQSILQLCLPQNLIFTFNKDESIIYKKL